MNKNYHLKQIWDNKFNETNFERYEWIESDTVAYKIIKPFLPQDKQCQILQLGCGTSHLSQIINKAGYTNVTCVDFSKRLIKKREKNQQIKYICADFTQKWKFQPQTKFDLIIDKGSLDCVFCDQNYLKRVLTCVNECYHRLRGGGRFISFSLGLPKNRVYWFRNKLTPFQEVQVNKQVNKSREELRKKGKNYNKDKQQNSEDYYVYICKKGQSEEQHDVDDNNMQGVNFDNQQENNQVQMQQKEQQQQKDYDHPTKLGYKNVAKNKKQNDNQQDHNDNVEQNQQEEQNQKNNAQEINDQENKDQQNNQDEENYQNQFDQQEENQ